MIRRSDLRLSGAVDESVDETPEEDKYGGHPHSVCACAQRTTDNEKHIEAVCKPKLELTTMLLLNLLIIIFTISIIIITSIILLTVYINSSSTLKASIDGTLNPTTKRPEISRSGETPRQTEGKGQMENKPRQTTTVVSARRDRYQI